ncbi:unnamed protein product, partial [Allacma fusca]
TVPTAELAPSHFSLTVDVDDFGTGCPRRS